MKNPVTSSEFFYWNRLIDVIAGHLRHDDRLHSSVSGHFRDPPTTWNPSPSRVFRVIDIDIHHELLFERDTVPAHQAISLRLNPQTGLPARWIVALFQYTLRSSLVDSSSSSCDRAIKEKMSDHRIERAKRHQDRSGVQVLPVDIHRPLVDRRRGRTRQRGENGLPHLSIEYAYV